MPRALLALPLLAALGCDDGPVAPPPSLSGRSNAAPVRSAQGEPSHAASERPAPKPARVLCDAGFSKAMPKTTFKSAKAAGGAELAAAPAFGTGKWVWVNLWAAWCGPCKEEMPRLLAWEKKLRGAGVMLELAFVSLDDDERQLQRFLDDQPATGVRSSWWLPEGDTRSGFVTGLGMKDPPQLPVQILVAPSGEAKCLVMGAVEESDYASLAKFVGAR